MIQIHLSLLLHYWTSIMQSLKLCNFNALACSLLALSCVKCQSCKQHVYATTTTATTVNNLYELHFLRVFCLELSSVLIGLEVAVGSPPYPYPHFSIVKLWSSFLLAHSTGSLGYRGDWVGMGEGEVEVYFDFPNDNFVELQLPKHEFNLLWFADTYERMAS